MIRPIFNRTKIVATIGPASSSKEHLHQLIKKGVDVCRLNFSHGTHEEHLAVINNIRELNEEFQMNTCILADLQGPKIRIGEVRANPEVILKEGQQLILTNHKCLGDENRIFINYGKFPEDAQIGDHVLIDDGKIELEVQDTNDMDEVKAVVIYGGKVSSRKGVNLPNTPISLPSLTEKDMNDLHFVLQHSVDWIALSFVRSAQDIRHLRKVILAEGKFTKIIAKIEKPQALDDINAIIEESDGVMIARGDLGVEVPLEVLPMAQKEMVNKCMQASKPVIIATQMMETMIQSPRPTRAEANDVANAVMDGADALMLSGETSVGKYPMEVVETMTRIIANVEKEARIYVKQNPISKSSVTFISDAICQNAVLLSHELQAKAIIGMTQSGYTAFKISSFRPNARIFIFSSRKELLNLLSLVWGVEGFYYDKYESTDQTFDDVRQLLVDNALIQEGDLLLNLASMPIQEKGRTNTVKVSRVI